MSRRLWESRDVLSTLESRDAGKLSLKTSAARPIEMDAFAEDGKDILIKLKVGCWLHPWACSQFPLVNNYFGLPSNFQILHEYPSLGESKLEL